MDETDRSLGNAAERRRQAEEIAREQAAQSSQGEPALSPEAIRKTLQELRVHQIELEMQNEELHRVQAELEISRARYFDLYDLAPVGYVTVSEAGAILEANLTAATLLGVARGSLVRRQFSQFVFHEDAALYYQRRTHLRETGAPQAWELRLVKQDGTAFWAHLEVTCAQEEAGAPVLRVVLNDVTERRQAEELRHQLEERMSQMQRLESLGILVAGVAHNMNNVLAAIMGAASMRESTATDPQDLFAYGIIGKACRRGRDVVKSLIHYSRPSPSSQAPLELHALITEVRVLLENATRNRIEIIESFLGEPLWVQGDAGNLNHVILNLCLNAVDAMPNGGTLTFRTAVPENDWIEVSVEDNGAGMTPEVLARVFDPFFTTKEIGKGTGLGLSMAYGVIKAHGGTLAVASHPGQGTLVTFRLPRIQAPIPKATVEARTPSLGPLHVLLVDDDVNFLELAEWALNQAGGFQVKSVSSGEAALESLESGPVPDLIILDQNMPRMDGIQTMEKIRVLHPNMRILISSGQPDIEEWACFQQPNVAVISKPFEIGELLARLAQFSLKPQTLST